MTEADDDDPVALSQLLSDLGEGEGTVTVDEMMDTFGHRAFGAVLFLFAVPNVLPLPPGSSTIFSIPLLILAPQLVVGRPHPWLPARMLRQSIRREALRPGLKRFVGVLRWVEKISAPRLTFLFGGVGDRMIGAVCALMAFILVFPIPLGNLLPGAAVTLLSLSMAQRDGVLTILGYLTAVSSIVVLVLGGQIVWAFFQKALELLPG